MPFDELEDYVGAVSGATSRMRRSTTPGDAPAAGVLRAGEPAVNAADGVMYVGKVDGTAGTIPGAVGFNQIVSLTQTEYDAITATASATTLYIVTPDPE
jgi:hypothetical protein